MADGGGLSRALRLLAAPPWRRAPLLLFGFRGVLLAIVAAGLILGVASAATPMFLDSAGGAALDRMRDARCDEQVGLTVVSRGSLGIDDRRGGSWDARLERKEQVLAEATGGIPHLQSPQRTVVLSSVTVVDGDRVVDAARLLYREGALDHVERLTAGSARGVWIADTTAERAGVRPGGQLTVRSPEGLASIPVAGVFRDLAAQPRDEYWCSVQGLIYQASPFAEYVPPPIVLVPDLDLAAEIGADLQEEDAEYRWEWALAEGPVSLAEAGTIARELGFVREAIYDEHSSHHPGLRDAFAQPNEFTSRVDPGASTELPEVVTRAQRVRASVEGSIGSVALAGQLIALLVIAAAGSYWVDRRRSEVALLASRGIGPGAVAGKAVLEVAVPLALATAAGAALAAALVAAAGPADVSPAGALPAGAGRAAVGFLVAIVLFAAVTAWSAHRSEREARAGAVGARVANAPWEVAVLGVAAAAFYELRGADALTTTASTGEVEVDVLLLLFPLLLLLGGAGLAVRLLRRALPRLRARGSELPMAGYLASRRLAGAPRSAQTLVLASSVALGILALAPILTASLSETIDQKALVFNGARFVQPMVDEVPLPGALRGRATAVEVLRSQQISTDSKVVDVVGVDPATFADGAFWDARFADASLESLFDRMEEGRTDRSIAVLAVGDVPDRTQLRLTGRGQTGATLVHVVGRPRWFPGMQGGKPLFVALRDDLPEFSPVEFWIDAGADEVVPVLTDAGLPVSLARTADEVRDQSDVLSVQLTFGFVQALGVLAGLVAVVGLVLYLEERQRVRDISYALARRMGLRRRDHRRSIAIELGVMLVAASVIGGGLGWLAGRLVHAKLDTQPDVPPAAAFDAPAALVPALLAAAVVVAVLGALAVQRRADRANVVEVLRRGA